MRVIVVGVVLLALTACSDAGTTSDDTAVDSSTVTTSTVVVPTTSVVPATTSSSLPPSTTDVSVATTAPPTTAATTPQGFERVAATSVTIEGTVCELCLWLADDADGRALGLMHVTDLGEADGMVFEYPGPTTGAFWMKNTVLPLSIAFYDATGTYLDSFDMEPCAVDPCPTYPTPTDFVYAVETTQGGLIELGLIQGSLLTVTDLPCE